MKGCFFIVGPTASGKSELAADVAARCGAEVVSADAFQIYRGLPLLTAQPDEATLRKAPHHLVGTVPPSEEMSAAKFRELALSAIGEINRRGKLAIVAGGSGLYLKALTHGLAPLPPVDAELRAELNALSLEELNTRLARGRSVRRGNDRPAEQTPRRQGAGDFCADQAAGFRAALANGQQNADGASTVFSFFASGRELYSRIDRRVEEMFREGVAEEVARLGASERDGGENARARGNPPPPGGKNKRRRNASAAIQQATRRYAKRQLTWFRREH